MNKDLIYYCRVRATPIVDNIVYQTTHPRRSAEKMHGIVGTNPLRLKLTRTKRLPAHSKITTTENIERSSTSKHYPIEHQPH